MDLSRRELLSAAVASVVARTPAHADASALNAQSVPAPPARQKTTYPPNLSIRDYLSREARRMTDNALVDFKTSADITRTAGQRRQRFMDMMGLADLPGAAARGPVPFKTTSVLDRKTYRIEKLHYESLPNLHVTANLYAPKITSGERRPGVLYVCGHLENQKFHYQAHARRFAELGFPTLIVETVQLGEVTGYHHGCYREGWFHWYSRGYSPAAIELLNGIRGLDLLAARRDVDSARLGVTGISGGGATTWWIAAADERVKVCSPVCGTAAIASHVYDRVIDGHCDCMWWINTALWDLADVGALIAPRPLLIASANQDGIFPIESIREVHSQLEKLYKTLGRPDDLRFVETPGGHSYHQQSRTAIFAWFIKHLMGKDVSPDQVGDIELDMARLESETDLKVYVTDMPPGNRALTIHDEFVKVAAPPKIAAASDVDRTRTDVVAKLRAETFNHFPRKPVPLDVVEEFALDGGVGTRFAFTSEEGWRLHGTRRQPPPRLRPDDAKGSAPAVVVLKSPGEERNASDVFAGLIKVPWVKVVVETRGTGDTSWGDDLNWHIRRASAWMGRSIASMRVWDTLRALEAVRGLPGIDPANLSVAARGEMGAVALYAALLDGRLKAVFLESPPATQNAPSEKDGRGPAIEMLSCLRYTDLPQVAGMLYPAEIVIAGEFPSTFSWAEDVYRRLGAPGKLTRVKALSDWVP